MEIEQDEDDGSLLSPPATAVAGGRRFSSDEGPAISDVSILVFVEVERNLDLDLGFYLDMIW